MDPAVKKAIDEFMADLGEYRRLNDERLAKLEKGEHVDPLITERLKKYDEALNQVEDLNQKITAAHNDAVAMKAKLETLETVVSRPGFGGIDPKRTETEERQAAFIEFCRKGPPDMQGGMDRDHWNVLTVSDDTKGGVLAPAEYVRDIIKGETEISPMRSVARVRQTMARSVQHPKRTGQFSAAWVAERGTRSETTGLTYGLEEIPTHEMYALVDVTEQDLEDSAFDLEAELRMEFAEQFAVLDGAAFITGNGVGKPEGITDTGAGLSSTNSGAASSIADANGQANGIIDLAFDIKTAYARNATWLLNRNTIASVRKLKDGDNNYIWRPGIAEGVPNTILDRPYVEMPDMPDEAANAFPIAFGDFRRGYLVVDRIAMTVLRDPYTQATSGAVRFIARRRVGGQVILAEAMRLLKCST